MLQLPALRLQCTAGQGVLSTCRGVREARAPGRAGQCAAALPPPPSAFTHRRVVYGEDPLACQVGKV